jgi:hypothetical protein
MTDAATLASGSRSTRKRTSFEEGLRIRIGSLLSEREALMEEVRQLRAAVDIYAEVVRRLECGDPRRAA